MAWKVEKHVFDEILKEAKLGWILEKIGKNFRQYFKAKNPREHKTIIEASNFLDPTQTWQIGANTDDASKYWNGSAWSFSLTGSYNGVGYYSSTYYKYGCGLRWTGLTIPQGATINSAYLVVEASDARSATVVNSKIQGHYQDNAATFSTLADWNARPRTAAIVNWDNIPAWSTGVEYTSPDIATIIQEIINRPGWASGNALALDWQDWEDRSTHATNCERRGYSHNYYPAGTPKLTVTWTSGGILKEVADSLSFSDAVSVNKNVIVTDSLSLVDSVLRNKPLVEVLDTLSLSDVVLVNKTMTVQDVLSIADAVSVETGVTLKEVLDTLTLQDLIKVNKSLQVTDSLTLQDFIQKVGEILLNKTKLDKAKLDKTKRDK